MRHQHADHYGHHHDPTGHQHHGATGDLAHHLAADHEPADHAPAGHHGTTDHDTTDHDTTDHHGTMSDLALLLDLQAHDVRLDQLRHRRAALPERAAIAELERQRAELATVLAGVRAERDTVAREQKRLEDEVALVAAKAAAEDKKLYSGSVTAPKELQAIQDEIAALQRRQRHLEDEILVQMEAAEPLDDALAGHEAAGAELDARLAETTDALRTAESAIDDEAATVHTERDAVAGSVPAVLLTEYEQLRRGLGGVAVAKLEGSSCRGCHLQLSAVEVGRIRKLDPDVLVHCEECGRILVR